MYWINGVLTKKISLDVRALHFGDGFFTTAKIYNGKIHLFNWHMERLKVSARRLMFNNVNYDILYEEIFQSILNYNADGIIKIIISRINKNKKYGYKSDNYSDLYRIIRISPLPKYYSQWFHLGVRLKTSKIRLSRNSFFAGIKHLNRLEQVMISYDINNDDKADEALVLDTDSNVIECCSANIFWRQKNQVFTPSLLYAGVNGVMRQLIIRLLPKLGYSIQEVMVGIERLQAVDEVFITNSLLPLAPVNSINDYFYTNNELCNILKNYVIDE